MQTAGGLADLLVEARLHVHVDVLQLFPPGEGAILHLLQDALETRADELRVLLRDDALATQHPRVGHRGRNVLAVEAAVIAHGGDVRRHEILALHCYSGGASGAGPQ